MLRLRSPVSSHFSTRQELWTSLESRPKYLKKVVEFRTVESSDSVATQSAEVCDEVECLEMLDEGDSIPGGLTDQDLEKLAEKLAPLLREQLAETLAQSISAEVIERTVQGFAERLGLPGLGK